MLEHALILLFVPACIDAAPPAARVLGSAAALRGGTADNVSGRAFSFMAQGWGDTAVMGEKLLAGAGGRRHAQRRWRHIDECVYGSLL